MLISSSNNTSYMTLKYRITVLVSLFLSFNLYAAPHCKTKNCASYAIYCRATMQCAPSISSGGNGGVDLLPRQCVIRRESKLLTEVQNKSRQGRTRRFILFGWTDPQLSLMYHAYKSDFIMQPPDQTSWAINVRVPLCKRSRSSIHHLYNCPFLL